MTELQARKYDLVIIDIESGTATDRLVLRYKLAQLGIPTYCRVMVEVPDAALLIHSWVAYKEEGDRLWTTQSYPGREFVVGGGPAPVGVFAAIPTPDPPAVIVPVPQDVDLLVERYPPYSPGPDIIILTGHLPPHRERGLCPAQCRALFPFVTNEHVLPALPPTPSYLWKHLLLAKCPRNRIQAVIRLHRAGLLEDHFVDNLYRHSQWIQV
jgi:hypothetical protein